MDRPAAPPSVLIVDDEPDLCAVVEHHLRQAGLSTRIAENGAAALAACAAAPPDLVLLDVNLPDLSGIDVCRAIRAIPTLRELPVLMLTARGAEADRVGGFEVGADDYVVKPFSVRELVLRVEALLRRRRRGPAVPPSPRLRAGPIELDVDDHTAWLDGAELPLTLLEFRLLRFLVEGHGRVRSREALLTEVWGYSTGAETRTVDTHVKRLRDKLGPWADLLETVRGVGYRLRVEGPAVEPEP